VDFHYQLLTITYITFIIFTIFICFLEPIKVLVLLRKLEAELQLIAKKSRGKNISNNQCEYFMHFKIRKIRKLVHMEITQIKQ